MHFAAGSTIECSALHLNCCKKSNIVNQRTGTLEPQTLLDSPTCCHQSNDGESTSAAHCVTTCGTLILKSSPLQYSAPERQSRRACSSTHMHKQGICTLEHQLWKATGGSCSIMPHDNLRTASDAMMAHIFRLRASDCLQDGSALLLKTDSKLLYSCMWTM
jgi:hypothetical protein